MIPDCTPILGVRLAEVSADACAAARAAIRAAEIQAKATRHLGILTLVAGVLAGVAARIAHKGILKQIQLEQNRQRVDTVAYTRQVLAMLPRAHAELSQFAVYIGRDAGSVTQTQCAHVFDLPCMMGLRHEFAPGNWKRHAYLSQMAHHEAIRMHDAISF